MEFKGRIYRLLPKQSGQRTDGTTWQKQNFIFEYFEHKTDTWSDKVLLNVMGDNIAKYDLHEGDEVVIEFRHRVREWNDKYFNELLINNLEKSTTTTHVDAGAVSQPQPSNSTQQKENAPTVQGKEEGKEDDLPF
jgi:hypothetical protein